MNLANARLSEGYAKYRLAHSRWGSFVVVDALFTPNRITQNGWDFYLPTFYGAPFLRFGIPSDDGSSDYDALLMSANVCSPRGGRPIALNIGIRSLDRAKTYPDGSQLSACTIQHELPLGPNRSGAARRVGDDFEIRLFHHTANETVPLIRSSGHYKGSPWNLRGTRKLANAHYVYFTTLGKIGGESDLQRIAMASDGMIVQRGMSLMRGFPDPVVEAEVYRSSTLDRRATLKHWVPVGSLAPNHLIKFSPWDANAYYEAILPEVARVGMKPGAKLAIKGDRVAPADSDMKTFDYVICGDASTGAGLAAPYDEESTDQIIHLENLQQEDIFEFWKRNMNTDQVTGRKPEFRLLEPRQS